MMSTAIPGKQDGSAGNITAACLSPPQGPINGARKAFQKWHNSLLIMAGDVANIKQSINYKKNKAYEIFI